MDVDYLINDTTTPLAFIHDKANNTDYVNANGHKFFAAMWEMEANNIGPLASPAALLQLKAFSFVQHCLQGHWNKVNSDEFDIKFLVLNCQVSELDIVSKYITKGQLEEVKKIIKSVRK
jgi:hypothetical protein